ncbi:three component ABC system middle component [Morganella morganii]|nr:three component ABC system middle component [Morganella morganii]
MSCQRVARYIGKEFARIADRVTVYTTFGIRP